MLRENWFFELERAVRFPGGRREWTAYLRAHQWKMLRHMRAEQNADGRQVLHEVDCESAGAQSRHLYFVLANPLGSLSIL